LGNPVEFTILEIAQKIIELTKSESKIVFMPLPVDDPIQRKPDISIATKELKEWKPTVTLNDGLSETINYFKSIIK